MSQSQKPAYQTPKMAPPFQPDGDWNKPQWQRVLPGELKNFMGERPRHFPKTQFKIGYDDESIYVIFRVEDRYVRAAVKQAFQGDVYRDSCVEFFFTPNSTPDTGYFNLEMNCGGALLLHWQTKPRQGREISTADCARIAVFHSMPRIVTPEIAEPTTWTVEYRLPISILKNYAQVTTPAPGASWFANFYKCADDTSHPHWLTWAPVELPEPDFHQPDWFGILEFT